MKQDMLVADRACDLRELLVLLLHDALHVTDYEDFLTAACAGMVKERAHQWLISYLGCDCVNQNEGRGVGGLSRSS